MSANQQILLGAGRKAPEIRDTTTGVKTALNNSTPTTLPSYVAGDILLIIITGYSDNVTSCNVPAGYTKLNGVNPSAYMRFHDVFYKVATGSESAPTITASGNIITCWCIMSIKGASAIEGAVTSGTGAVTPDAPTLAPSWGADNNLWIVTGGHYGGTLAQSQLAGYSGFTQLVNAYSGDRPRQYWNWIEELSASKNPAPWIGPLTGSPAGFGAHTIALRP